MNIKYHENIYSDLVLLFKDIKILYQNLYLDPEIKWIKIKIFFFDKDNKKYKNNFYIKTRNNLNEEEFFDVLKAKVIKNNRNFPSDIENYKIFLLIEYITS